MKIFSNYFPEHKEVILKHAYYLFTYAISGVPEEMKRELLYIVHMPHSC
jgi:hypothetical protein